MPEPPNHIDASEARRLVEAHRLKLGDLAEWTGPLYFAIRQAADRGETTHNQVLHDEWGPAGLSRPQLAAIVMKLKDDGFIVDQDGGVLTINWGRMA
jgi:hypothetical protein